MDETESLRRSEVARIHSEVASDDKDSERQRLIKQYGAVWDTSDLTKDFEVLSFTAPYVVVRRKSDGVLGSLEFQARPRFYFNFQVAT